jgi:hypothetical protein
MFGSATRFFRVQMTARVSNVCLVSEVGAVRHKAVRSSERSEEVCLKVFLYG